MENTLTPTFVTSDFNVYHIKKIQYNEDTQIRAAYISFNNDNLFIKKGIEKYGSNSWVSDNSLGFWMDTNYFIGGSTENLSLFLSNALFLCKAQKIEKVYVIAGSIEAIKIAVNNYHKSNVNLIMCDDYQYAILD